MLYTGNACELTKVVVHPSGAIVKTANRTALDAGVGGLPGSTSMEIDTERPGASYVYPSTVPYDEPDESTQWTAATTGLVVNGPVSVSRTSLSFPTPHTELDDADAEVP